MQTINEDAALSVEQFFEALKHHSDLHRAFRPSHKKQRVGDPLYRADQRTAATAAFIAETMAR